MGALTDIFTRLTDFCTYYLSIGGPVIAIFLLLSEAFIPILPLNIFVALNVNAFGLFFGILLSWIGTCIGCFLCYLLFYSLSDKLYNLFSNKTKEKIEKISLELKCINLSQLMLIMILPFMPSFIINIVSGIIKISPKKFLIALLVGKIFMITFWGFIGKSFLESITDIKSIIYIIIALLIAYIFSKIISKKMKIE